MSAVRLQPSLREKIWGRTSLEPWFRSSEQKIGEVWYLSGRELPLLVKLLFTSDFLSVQLHPDDGEDGPRGKTEMWHILEAEPGARIALGFRQPVARERLVDSTCTGEIEDLLNWLEVHPGETYFVPAHTVHAIGAGIVLCEIQQNSDVTYRLWDYGRPRPLHIEQAAPLADLGVHPGASRPLELEPGRHELVRARHFTTELVHLAPGSGQIPPPHHSQIWIVLEGAGEIGGEPYRPGEAWLLPDRDTQPAVRAQTASRFLRTWAPSPDA
jgi:mannose-6-phosphate isomerase